MLLAGLSAIAQVARNSMEHAQLMVTNTARFRLDDEVTMPLREAEEKRK